MFCCPSRSKDQQPKYKHWMMEKHLISHLVRGEQLATNVVQASLSLDLFTAPLVVSISFTLIQTQLCKRITCPQVQSMLKFSLKEKLFGTLCYLSGAQMSYWRSQATIK